LVSQAQVEQLEELVMAQVQDPVVHLSLSAPLVQVLDPVEQLSEPQVPALAAEAQLWGLQVQVQGPLVQL
jgi:hypothetical protein